MTKKILITIAFILGVFPLLVKADSPPAPVPLEKRDQAAYALAKIKVFKLENNLFVPDKVTPGVLITADGKILTSLKGIQANGVTENVYYQVCVYKTEFAAPNDRHEYDEIIQDCNFTAYKIAEDEENDLAVLQTEIIPDYSSQISFSSLGISKVAYETKGDNIVVIGYKNNNYDEVEKVSTKVTELREDVNNDIWYKSTVVGTFNGGFVYAIDVEGDIVAWRTKDTNTDFPNNQYFTSSARLYDWVSPFVYGKNYTWEIFEHQNRFIGFIKKQYDLAMFSQSFLLEPVGIGFDKIMHWDFIYEAENQVRVDYLIDEDSGWAKFKFYELPFAVTLDSLEEVLPMLYLREGKSLIIENQYSLTLDYLPALEYKIKSGASLKTNYYFAIDNYVVEVETSFGEGEKNKDEIMTILNSVKNVPPRPYYFTEEHLYSNDLVQLSIGGLDDWAIGVNEANHNLVTIHNIDNPKIVIDIMIEELPEEIWRLSDEFYFDILVGNNSQSLSNKVKSQENATISLSLRQSDVKFNDSIASCHQLNYMYRKGSSMYSAQEKILRKGKYLLRFRYRYLENNNIVYNENISKAEEFLATVFIEDVVPETEPVVEEVSPTENNGSAGVDPEIIELESIVEEPVVLLAFSGNRDNNLINRLQGKIILQVEGRGEAWYVNPKDKLRHFLGRPADAFALLRQFGQGITNDALNKIPIGYMEMSGKDSDGDGLSDKFEEAIGTDMYKSDTDDDDFSDLQELLAGFSPVGGDEYEISNSLIDRFIGQFVIQVQGNGEAWYINPRDRKRYYLGTPADAFAVMSQLGLGVSNENIANIPM